MINSYSIYPKWNENWRTTINHISLNKAKMEYLAVNELHNENYIHLRGRKLGEIETSEDFKRVARMRSVPDVYCGMRVEFDGKEGYIAGHEGGCNFIVYFPETDTTDCCHPHYLMKYFDNKGNVVYDFSKSK